jgi:hypothetical protein
MSTLKRLAKKAHEDSTLPVHPPAKDVSDETKVNGVEDHDMEDGPNGASKDLDENALLDDLAEMESYPATDFLPLSDAIFHGIFANTKELSSAVIADYIALGEILH